MDPPPTEADADPGPQVRVTFTTSDADPGLKLPDSKRQLLVPVSMRRYGLSRILNSESMLDTSSKKAVPFDFIVNGASFLRSSLADYLRNNGLSPESTLTLHYVRSLPPPVFEASFEHDDWVSAVDVLSAVSPAGRWSSSPGENSAAVQPGRERVLSASYDGLLRVWDASGLVLAVSPSASHGGHAAPIRAAKFMTSTQVASAGMDRTVRVWRYTETEPTAAEGDEPTLPKGELKPALELYGHTAPIDSVEVDGRARRILTASQDGLVGLWSASKASAPEVADPALISGTTPAAKRRKVASAAATSAYAPQRGPLFLIPASHAGAAPASAAVFDRRDRTVAYSAAHDHTLRTLDLTSGRVVSTLTLSHPLLSLCALNGGGSAPLLAAGTSARHVSIVDPRVGPGAAASAAVLTLRGHTNKVVALAAGEHALASASHDGTCRVWDLRSVRPATRDEGGVGSVGEPVYVIEREGGGRGAARAAKKNRTAAAAGEGVKVFSLVWDRMGIFSAGEDRRVQVNRGREGT